MIDPRIDPRLPKRIALLGGESSGKSTLAHALAEQLGGTAVDEYGRSLWEARDGALDFDDMLGIATTQIAMEEQAMASGAEWVVCDTTPLTTLFYSLDIFGWAAPQLEQLAERPYDYLFLCAPDFPFVQDGTRREAGFRDVQHRWYVTALEARKLPYRLLEGSVAQRVATAMADLINPQNNRVR